MKNFAFLLLALLPACGDSDSAETPDATSRCSAATAGQVTGTIISGPTARIVRSEIVVRGTASHSEGRAIRNIRVAGVRATNDEFNFGAWSVTLPISLLATLEGSEGDADRVTIEVVAEDSCDSEFAIDSFDITVDRTPEVVVERLDLAVGYPTADNYLPASGQVPGTLTITANPDATGAVVDLSSASGTFTGTQGGKATLGGDGTSDATVTVLFSSDTAGELLVTATAEGEVGAAVVRVAGPPSLVPSSATLGAGQEIPVVVLTEGAVPTCQATPAQELTVESGGANLMEAPAGTDTTGDGKVDIQVSAADTLTAATETTITCSDPFGQFSTGTYSGSP